MGASFLYWLAFGTVHASDGGGGGGPHTWSHRCLTADDARVVEALGIWASVADVQSCGLVAHDKADIRISGSLPAGGKDVGGAGCYTADGTRTGAITHCDIFLRADVANFPATILHEVGHALGLDHSASPEDVMYPDGYSWRQPTLAPGDVSAAGAIWGPARHPYRYMVSVAR